MSIHRSTRPARTLLVVALALAPAAAGAFSKPNPPGTLTYNFNSGTALTANSSGSFSGSRKSGQFLRFTFDPQDQTARTEVLTLSGFDFQGPWDISSSDLQTATYSSDATVNYDPNNPSSLSVTIANFGADNFFQLPVDTFGDSFTFQMTVSSDPNSPPGASTLFDVQAQDDSLDLAQVQFTPGSAQSVLVSSAPGVYVVGTHGTADPAPAPEPSAPVTLALGVGALTLSARKASRRSA